MLNIKSYFSKSQNIEWSTMPEALAKGHKLVEGASQNNWSAYNTNENIKRVIDAYFQKLAEYLDKNAPHEKSESAKPRKKPKESSTATKPPAAFSSPLS